MSVSENKACFGRRCLRGSFGFHCISLLCVSAQLLLAKRFLKEFPPCQWCDKFQKWDWKERQHTDILARLLWRPKNGWKSALSCATHWNGSKRGWQWSIVITGSHFQFHARTKRRSCCWHFVHNAKNLADQTAITDERDIYSFTNTGGHFATIHCRVIGCKCPIRSSDEALFHSAKPRHITRLDDWAKKNGLSVWNLAWNFLFISAEFGDHDYDTHTPDYLKDYVLLPRVSVHAENRNRN